MPVTGAWWCELAALPDGPAERVLLETAGDRVAAVTTGVDPPPGATRLAGLTLPGLVNAHSHAFHRALRGRTHDRGGDFWSWRTLMYAVAARLDPDRLLALARAVFAEMALAGVTTVGEFHYLHRAPGGAAYAEPNAMGQALLAAAEQAGLRITLLDTCYLRGGFGRPLAGVQLRFGDGSAAAWAERVGGLRPSATARVGAAVHSVRAVPRDAIWEVAAWAAERDRPLHVHLSEQPAENAGCLETHGCTPTELLAACGALGPRTTAVHAVHLTETDIRRLGDAAATACLCPTTERDLADGVAPARALVDAGAALALGSDSHAVIDLLEEARAVELDERLVSLRRGRHRPAALLAAATSGGAAALGWPEAGRLAPGALADLVAVDLGSPRLAGLPARDAVAGVVFAGTAADVTDVVVGARPVVRQRRHLLVDDVPGALRAALGSLEEAP